MTGENEGREMKPVPRKMRTLNTVDKKHDDCVLTILDTLSQFDTETQNRIIRWACERLGISVPFAPEGSIVSDKNIAQMTAEELELHIVELEERHRNRMRTLRALQRARKAEEEAASE